MRAGPSAAAPAPRFVPPPDWLVPTAEQRALQLSGAFTLVVEARAGAAKTTSLALRWAEAWARGLPTDDALVLTYTDAACTAFRQALLTIGVPAEVAQGARVTTFEAFAVTVLQRIEGAAVPARLLPEALRDSVWEAVERVVTNEGERWPDALEYPSVADTGFVAEFLDCALWIKGTLRLERDLPEGGLTPDEAEGIGQRYMLLRTLRAYERLRAGGHPDRPAFRGPGDATYDLACRLLRGEEGGDGVGTAWPRHLLLVLVDEMHDMNETMFCILRRLLQDRRTVFCGVGDMDQVIHAAAGADASFLRGRIEADTGRRTDTLPLGTSFRFGDALARPAARFIAKPLRSASVHDTQVVLSPYGSAADCAAQVLADVRNWRKAAPRNAAGLAVLLRHDAQSIVLENAFVGAGIAYRLAGFDSYLLRPEVLLVRGLLTIATRDFASMQDRTTLARIVEAFVLFCGTRFDDDPALPGATQTLLMAQAVRDFADNAENLPLFLENHVLRKAKPAAARRLRAAIAVAQDAAGAGRFDRFLEALDMRWFVAQALVRPERRAAALRHLDGLRTLAAGFPDASAFFGHLQASAAQQAKLRRGAAITVARVADVKGLEFEEVLLPFLEQGEFPDAQAPAGDEANLFYVAVTRARRTLRLYLQAERPSAFVARAGWRLPPRVAAHGDRP